MTAKRKRPKRNPRRTDVIRWCFADFAKKFLPDPAERDAVDRLIEFAHMRGFMSGYMLREGLHGGSDELLADTARRLTAEANTLERIFFTKEIEDLVASGELDVRGDK